MGKGFNNYMSKKFFHPASRDNLKRVWMAEQQAEAYKKKQEELRAQYEKEQNLHENKAMLSKDSKDKLSVNFMYEPPPGMKKEREKEDNEPEYKFEWQRKYNAPRESYCKGDTEIRDQPFGIQVRNVRCIKCHKYGHINTDKECGMFSLSMSEAKKIHSDQEASSLLKKGGIEDQLKEDGLAMKRNALSLYSQQSGRLHQLIPEEGDNEDERKPETELLKGLTKKQKKELLKKLELIEKRHIKKQFKKRSKSSSSSSDSGDDDRSSRKKQSKKSKRKRRSNSSSDNNSNDNDSENDKKHYRKQKEEYKSSRTRDVSVEKSRRDRNDEKSRNHRDGRDEHKNRRDLSKSSDRRRCRSRSRSNSDREGSNRKR